MAEISGGSIVYSVDLNTTQATKAADDFSKGAKKAETASSNFGKTLKDSVGGVLSGFIGPELRIAGKLLGALSKDLKANTVATAANAKGTKAMTVAQKASNVATLAGAKALRILKVALISTGIGAIVVALGSLVAAFTTTQKGIDAVNRVTRTLSTLFQRIIGVAQNLGTSLIETFSDPKQALIDFANLIRDNVVNRFNGLLQLLPKLGEALSLLFEGKFSQAGKVAADAVAQVALGVTDFTDKVAEATETGAEFANEVLNQGNALADLDIAIRKATLEFTKQEAELNNIIASQRELASDTSKTESERAEAAQKALIALNQRAKLEEDVIKLEIERLKLEQSLNETTDEGFQELAELEARLLGVQTTASRERRFLTAAQNAANKQAADEEQKRREEAAKDEIEKAKASFELEKQRTELIAREAEIQAKIRFAQSKGTEQDEQDLADELFRINQEKFASLLQINKDYKDKLALTNEEIKQAELDLAEAQIQINKNKNKELEKQEKEAAQKRKEVQQEIISLSTNLLNELFAFGNTLRQREIEAIQAKVDAELITEEQAAQQIGAIKRKQAQSERAQALFNVGINLATAISRLLANPGIAGGAIPLIALTSAISAAQTASILAQPLPAFAEGTLNAPGGMALVGEQGPELVKLPRGSQVMPTPQTMLYDSIMQGGLNPESLLAGIDYDGGRQWDDSKLRRVGERGVAVNSQMLSEIKGLRKAIIGTPKKYK